MSAAFERVSTAWRIVYYISYTCPLVQVRGRLRGFHFVQVAFPGVGDAANCLAEPHGEIHNGLQPLRVDGAQAILVHENEFRVAENSGERIIDLVPKNGRDITIRFGPWRAEYVARRYRPAQPSFHEAGCQRIEISGARHELDVSGSDEPGNFRLAFRGRKQNHRRRNRDVPQKIFERRVADKLAIEKRHLDRDAPRQAAKVIETRSDSQPGGAGNVF